MQETPVPSLGREDSLEKEITTHSSILTWKFRGQGSLVGYSPWGCKRVGPDFVTKQQQCGDRIQRRTNPEGQRMMRQPHSNHDISPLRLAKITSMSSVAVRGEELSHYWVLKSVWQSFWKTVHQHVCGVIPVWPRNSTPCSCKKNEMLYAWVCIPRSCSTVMSVWRIKWRYMNAYQGRNGGLYYIHLNGEMLHSC